MRKRGVKEEGLAPYCAPESTFIAWAARAATCRQLHGEERQTSLTSDSQYRKIMTSAMYTKTYYTINKKVAFPAHLRLSRPALDREFVSNLSCAFSWYS